jgi:hypothetical protein
MCIGVMGAGFRIAVVASFGPVVSQAQKRPLVCFYPPLAATLRVDFPLFTIIILEMILPEFYFQFLPFIAPPVDLACV